MSEASWDLWGKVVAKAWEDEEFAKRLRSSPQKTLAENGIEIAPGVEVRLVENTDKVLYFTLPAKPSEAELSDEELEKVAGGVPPSVPDPPCSGAKPRVPKPRR